jgi:ribose/xylose/arabinose/galactoside ABC-type transport system permease subunit
VSELGKLLVIIGLMIIAVGIAFWTGVGRDWLGKLPGDIAYRKGNFSFYFPIVTCLVLSAVLTLIFWVLRR